MGTFITRLDEGGGSERLAVKDLMDMVGVPTTAGCKALADIARPAPTDASCLLGARQAGVRIVGRTNLHELALGVTGVNPWFGTPINPLDPRLVPGGSSSGSAVAVATGEADIAYGSDTGGSVRIPSACCGTAGLKTTWGRIPLGGVWPLSTSLDTVGPMATSMSGLLRGMQLLEPGFAAAAGREWRVGRWSVEADPLIEAAIDRALSAVEWEVEPVQLAGWDAATTAAGTILVSEAWNADRHLVESAPSGIGEDVKARLGLGRRIDDSALDMGRQTQAGWKAELALALRRVDLIATPTLTIFPPELDRGEDLLMARCTLPVNLSGLPALVLPVPTSGPLPASIQLIGRNEEELLAAGVELEQAIASL
ncbi:MAG TPA: amidase [Acidimicrobiales bacterium]|nr:amidase [Acidimicrobiales bacterium]